MCPSARSTSPRRWASPRRRSTRRVNALKEKGLVDQPYYGDITLTDDGYEYGQSILDRHHLLFTFLTKVLGIPEERADEEACIMEHAISDDSFEKWTAYIKSLDLD